MKVKEIEKRFLKSLQEIPVWFINNAFLIFIAFVLLQILFSIFLYYSYAFPEAESLEYDPLLKSDLDQTLSKIERLKELQEEARSKSYPSPFKDEVDEALPSV